jgi:hypothetical protein
MRVFVCVHEREGVLTCSHAYSFSTITLVQGSGVCVYVEYCTF